MEGLMPKGTVYKMLGWKRHSKRSKYGHFFIDGKCIDCGLIKEEWKCLTYAVVHESGTVIVGTMPKSGTLVFFPDERR